MGLDLNSKLVFTFYLFNLVENNFYEKPTTFIGGNYPCVTHQCYREHWGQPGVKGGRKGKDRLTQIFLFPALSRANG